MNRSFNRIITAALIVASAGAVTLAREPAGPNPLSGPKVQDNSPPGVNQTLDGGQRDRRRAGGERNRPMLFMGAVMSLSRPETPESLRLTDEQRAQVEAIGKEYADALRAFRDAHREEIDALRGDRPRGQRDGAGGPRGQGDGAGGQRGPGAEGRGQQRGRQDMTPEQQKKADELRALMDQAPKAEPFQTRMWALLSPEQQALATERLNEMKSRGPDGMGDRVRDRAGDGQRPRRDRRDADAPPPPGPPPGARGGEGGRGPRAEGRSDPPGFQANGRFDRRPGFGPPPPPDDRARVTFEDLRARLDRLPPEQRERVLRRMMESLDRLEERAPRDRPPPPMRDVEVPPGA